MSNKQIKKTVANTEEAKAAEVVEETVDAKNVEAANTEKTTTSETESPVYGYVSNCVKLNVRKKPDKEAEILTEINAGETVEINLDLSTSNFYSVATATSGVAYTGYCMKDFITIK